MSNETGIRRKEVKLKKERKGDGKKGKNHVSMNKKMDIKDKRRRKEGKQKKESEEMSIRRKRKMMQWKEKEMA